MAYRDDVTALSARHDALAAELADKTRELEESRWTLEQARARARLPVLDQIRVATPCTADWSQMTGDDRARHCGECQKDVYDLSGLTRDEAEALIREHHGELCVRYYQRHDGTILLADCAAGVQRRRRQGKAAARAAALVAGGLLVAGTAASRITMGKMAPHDEPPRGVPGHQLPVRMGLIAPAEPDVPQVPDGEPIERESVFPPIPPPPAPHARQILPDVGRPVMGAARALPWNEPSEPSPAQPAAHPTRHPPAAPGKRAR